MSTRLTRAAAVAVVGFTRRSTDPNAVEGVSPSKLLARGPEGPAGSFGQNHGTITFYLYHEGPQAGIVLTYNVP